MEWYRGERHETRDKALNEIGIQSHVKKLGLRTVVVYRMSILEHQSILENHTPNHISQQSLTNPEK